MLVGLGDNQVNVGTPRIAGIEESRVEECSVRGDFPAGTIVVALPVRPSRASAANP
jgi:hypothetical protein